MSSAAADRQSLYRKRKARQLRCVQLEIRHSEIEELIRRGLLNNETKGDRLAVRDALYAHLDKTLQGAA